MISTPGHARRAWGDDPSPVGCATARAALEARFDGEQGDLSEHRLDGHLESCEACAAFEADLHALRSMILDLPAAPLPADALEEVLARTVDRPVIASPFAFHRRPLHGLAIAAVLTLSVVGAWFAAQPASIDDGFSEVELARLERDLYLVMNTLGSAVHRRGAAAVNAVLIDETAPTLRAAPMFEAPPDP